MKLIILISIFLFSLGLRLVTINQTGRTWDEFQYAEQGYKLVELIKKGDFGNNFFHTSYDHPPLVKYLYGITAHFDVEKLLKNRDPIFKYDYTFSRILSAIMFSIGVIITVLIGWKIFSPTVGIIAGIILSMLPFSFGLSQLVTAESLKIITYPLTIYSYLFLMKERITKMNILLAGIATGIALQAKQTNFLLLILLGIILLLQVKRTHALDRRKILSKRILIFLGISTISILVFFTLWPQSIFHIKEILEINQKLWNPQFSSKIWQITLAPPEVFFGRLMLVPIFYYFVYFFISIPVLILILFFAGLKNLIKQKNIYFLVILLWFLLPFSLSFYSWRQHGLRYIIEIYPAFSIIAAVGVSLIVDKFKSKTLKGCVIIILFLYLIFTLFKIRPYYLDYFNELVGGVNNVYEKKLFQIGWWGQGVGEAGKFIEMNAPKGSRIGLAISPEHVFPGIKDLKISRYHKDSSYDYVVVNYYNALREGFDDSYIKKNYKLTYEVLADEAVLVSVYSR
ncbi:MAG: glycosyltransferase family 39 protein [Patescibacteria group bacterium]